MNGSRREGILAEFEIEIIEEGVVLSYYDKVSLMKSMVSDR